MGNYPDEKVLSTGDLSDEAIFPIADQQGRFLKIPQIACSTIIRLPTTRLPSLP